MPGVGKWKVDHAAKHGYLDSWLIADGESVIRHRLCQYPAGRVAELNSTPDPSDCLLGDGQVADAGFDSGSVMGRCCEANLRVLWLSHG